MGKEQKTILVINGPNLNLLGLREPAVYGNRSYRDLCQMITAHAEKRGVRVEFFQSNHEGALVDAIQNAYGRADGIILNPAAYTHTSVALPDALKAVGIPTVEVHISDVNKREPFRRKSYVRAACIDCIAGHGFAGYCEALDRLLDSNSSNGEKGRSHMRVTIEKSIPYGEVRLPTSKSMAHRYLIAAAFTKGRTVIDCLPDNRDIRATVRCLRAMGVQITLDRERGYAEIYGIDPRMLPVDEDEETVLDCDESGTTLRLLLPFALLGTRPVTFIGAPRLLARPLSVYEQICRERGLLWEKSDSMLRVCGPLTGGEFTFAGNISSQFASGLLLVMPHLKEPGVLQLTDKLESLPYVNMTVATLEKFGHPVLVQNERRYLLVNPGGKGHTPKERLVVPADESAAAFFGALGMLGGEVQFAPYLDDALQGDRVWRSYMSRLGKEYCSLSVADCPDLAPILCVVAALHHGGVLTDTARLRLKESDRGAAMAEELAKCGVQITVEENEIRIPPSAPHAPTEMLCSHNDHRIAMSLAVLLCTLGGTVDGAECVAKSMPAFWEMLRGLHVTLHTENGLDKEKEEKEGKEGKEENAAET